MANDWRRQNRKPALESIPSMHINKTGLVEQFKQSVKDGKAIKAGKIATCTAEGGAKVGISATECNYGGLRYWFICPSCNRNRLVLRYLEKSNSYHCNDCLNGVHQTTQQSKSRRRFNRRANIRERLGLERHHGLIHRIICTDKPKGMHWKTFTPLMREHNWLIHIDTQLWINASCRIFPHMKELLNRD